MYLNAGLNTFEYCPTLFPDAHHTVTGGVHQQGHSK